MKVQSYEGISLKGESLLDRSILQEIKIVSGVYNIKKGANSINNAKYSMITFIPLVLYQQFRHFFNIYFLGLTITQFVPVLKVGFLVNYIGPLSLVIMLSVCKEAYDDWHRHVRDREINEQLYQITNADGQLTKRSENLSPGMIVRINEGERIPADLIVLQDCALRTENLDGETDWKFRKGVSVNEVYVEQPSKELYQFKGYSDGPITLENTAWGGCVLASSKEGYIQGLIIYTGADTRLAMNQHKAESKMGIFDKEVDHLSKLLFLLMVILAVIISACSAPILEWSFIISEFMRYLILVSNMIPISMRVNLEFAKLVYAKQIDNDGITTRNSNLPECLGRIQYLLCDKTGTLTQNEMVFKEIRTNKMYSDWQYVKQIITDQLRINKFPFTSRSDDARLRDFLTCLAVCHNVTPIEKDGERTYQGSSPDEIAMVKFANEVGYKVYKTDKEVKIQTSSSTELYEILHVAPFESSRKRMTMVVRISERILVFVKGADSVLEKMIGLNTSATLMKEECEQLASKGLRTMVMCTKEINQSQYKEFKELVDNSNRQVNSKVDPFASIENNLEFLGVSGVEDKLQEDTAQTIETLRSAGVKVWMLTGDRLETALCVAILSQLSTNQVVTIDNIQDEIQLQMLLTNFDPELSPTLIIDGVSLQTALSSYQELLISTIIKCNTLICCRCSPDQKKTITDILKAHTNEVIAAIGDGGNDVPMIQSAHIGLGIYGKEGKQAALASDFSLTQFNQLTSLLLWHGRLSYKRSALLSQFIIHRGLLIAITQAIFMMVFSFLSISLFSGLLMLGYSTLFTMFPVFCIILDQDIEKEIAIQYPALYSSIQNGRFLNAKTFLIWVWKAVYQSFTIMMCAFFLVDKPFLTIETTVFTCLIFTQYAMTLTELESFRWEMIVVNLCSLIVYLFVLWIFPAHLMISDLTFEFFLYVLLIMVLSWAPLYVAKWIMNRIDPSDSQKLMKYK